MLEFLSDLSFFETVQVVLIAIGIIIGILYGLKLFLSWVSAPDSIKKKIKCLGPIFRARYDLNEELFNYLFFLENRFSFAKQGKDSEDGTSIKNTISALEKLVEILKANAENEETEKAKVVFSESKMSYLKLAIDKMVAAVEKALKSNEEYSALSDEELEKIQDIANSWHEEKFSYDNAYGISVMLYAFLQAVDRAEGII